MDKASNFQKMVCCDKCYRIYHDTPKMRYRDRYNNLLARRCYGEVVQNGMEQLCNEVPFNCKKTDRGTHEYTPKHIYCYQPLSKSLDNLLSRLGILDKANAWRKRPATCGVCLPFCLPRIPLKIPRVCRSLDRTGPHPHPPSYRLVRRSAVNNIAA